MQWNVVAYIAIEMHSGPGPMAQLARASSPYAKVVGSITNEGHTPRDSPMRARI